MELTDKEKELTNEINQNLEKFYSKYTITSTFGQVTGQPLFKANGTLYEDNTYIEAEQLYSSEFNAKKALVSFAEVHRDKNKPAEKPKISLPKQKTKPSK